MAALGLENRVEFVGFRPESAPDFRAADVVMIPSRYDGMALVLLEAMACGAAIVAARVPGTSALGAAGELVPVDDPASLARAADALIGDPERRREHRDAVDWDRADAMLDFGGIRIEDNVLVTDDGHEVITADVPVVP